MQFTADGSLLGRFLLQILHVLHQRVLHGGKRVAQFADLVFLLYLRQRCLEVAFGHLVSRLGQFTQGANGLSDVGTAEQPDDHQTDDDDEQKQGNHCEGPRPHCLLRNHYRHRPVRGCQRGIIHNRPHTVDRHRGLSPLHLHHVLDDALVVVADMAEHIVF